MSATYTKLNQHELYTTEYITIYNVKRYCQTFLGKSEKSTTKQEAQLLLGWADRTGCDWPQRSSKVDDFCHLKGCDMPQSYVDWLLPYSDQQHHAYLLSSLRYTRLHPLYRFYRFGPWTYQHLFLLGPRSTPATAEIRWLVINSNLGPMLNRLATIACTGLQDHPRSMICR